MSNEQASAEIARLQSELAFQGDSVQRLNDALATQQQDILLLQRQVELLAEQLRALRERGASDGIHGDAQGPEAPELDRPPHY